MRAFVDGDAENVDVLTDGTNTVYPLNVEEIIDISEIQNDIEPFKAEYGSITFKNKNGDNIAVRFQTVWNTLCL